MRFVGNSYAVSIPKEIVDYIKKHEQMMDDMVRLCIEEFGILRLDFCNPNANNSHNLNNQTQLSKINNKPN